MNSAPTNMSASTVARPTAFLPARFSSESVEIPSNPRNDSTAIEVAPATVLKEKTCAS